MTDAEKTVFISYRREVSKYAARLVFLDLREKGYDVFMDVENIFSGTFDTIILNQIAARAHFLIILAPGSLVRCANPDDWLRREIERAMELERNIVPVMFDDFNFGDEKTYLEGELTELPRYSGLPVYYEYFDAAMDRLRTRFLKKSTYADITPTPKAERKAVAAKIKVAEVEKSLKPPQKRKPKAKKSPDILTITSPIKMEFVRIPAGEFLMGSDPKKDRYAKDNEQPQRRGYLSEYYIGKYPVTNAQYKAFAKTNWYILDVANILIKIPWGKNNHPVVNVSWYQARYFCEWLTGESVQYFSLPTEAQWEKAARGTDGRIYPWGDEWDASRLNSEEAGISGTTPVGQFSPQGDSPYGAADMAGNVWEWVADWYGARYYQKYQGEPRVLRGGATPVIAYPFAAPFTKETLSISGTITTVFGWFFPFSSALNPERLSFIQPPRWGYRTLHAETRGHFSVDGGWATPSLVSDSEY